VKSASTTPAWYCLRSRRKQEHIAAAHVRVLGDVTVFCPRIHFRRATRRGVVCVDEALFPGYFFARFALSELLLRVRAAYGVSSIVRFGDGYPVLPDCVVEQLREAIWNATAELLPILNPGANVKVISGVLAGLDAVIVQVLPAKERVKVLLEFLGREAIAEVASMDLLPD
jgi:transcriptional antiterminator RfaH